MLLCLYFAYGSNLDEQQMRIRCPNAVVCGNAVLAAHALAFRGHSYERDGAVAAVVSNPERSVPGILYRVTEADVVKLDKHEGHPLFYARGTTIVIDAQDVPVRALIYRRVRDADVPGEPSLKYLEMIQRAYRRWGFPWTHSPGD